MKITSVLSLAVVLLSTVISGCSGEKNQAIEAKKMYVIPDSLLKTLTIDTVKNQQLITSIRFTGMVDANQDNQVNIFPLVSGNVSDIKVQLGDYVTAGQVLAIVRSGEMANLSSGLIAAQANVTATKRQLDAAKDLNKSGLNSNTDVVLAQSNYDQAIAQLEATKKVLKINGDNTNGEWIAKAPVSGFIVSKNVTNGSNIRADNGNSLFTIADLKNVWVWANVYESNINDVHLNDEVGVTTLSYPGKIFTGKVDKILNALDPQSKVMKVRIVIPNPNYELKPQMFASITIANPENIKANCIPTKALIYDNSRYYVLVYTGKGNVSIRPVELLNTQGDKTYLKSGVNEGEQIISTQAILIYGELNS